MITQIIATGQFGRDVADHLVALLSASGETARAARDPGGPRLPGLLAGCDRAVFAAWREVRTELDELATAAAHACRPWLPVVFSHSQVRVGPVFAPDAGPCHVCFHVRSRQHSDVDPAVTDELDRQQTRDPGLGVTGYPPHLAALAAGQAVGLLRAASGAGRQARAGRLVMISCLTDAVRVRRLVPQHGCPHCHPESEQRATAKARADQLRELAGRGRDGATGGGRSVDS